MYSSVWCVAYSIEGFYYTHGVVEYRYFLCFTYPIYMLYALLHYSDLLICYVFLCVFR